MGVSVGAGVLVGDMVAVGVAVAVDSGTGVFDAATSAVGDVEAGSAPESPPQPAIRRQTNTQAPTKYRTVRKPPES
jgi:hypothetical protein